jgi:hypothetical protein
MQSGCREPDSWLPAFTGLRGKCRRGAVGLHSAGHKLHRGTRNLKGGESRGRPGPPFKLQPICHQLYRAELNEAKSRGRPGKVARHKAKAAESACNSDCQLQRARHPDTRGSDRCTTQRTQPIGRASVVSSCCPLIQAPFIYLATASAGYCAAFFGDSR